MKFKLKGNVYLNSVKLNKVPHPIDINTIGAGVWSLLYELFSLGALKTIVIKYDPSLENANSIIREKLSEFLENVADFNTPADKSFVIKMFGSYDE